MRERIGAIIERLVLRGGRRIAVCSRCWTRYVVAPRDVGAATLSTCGEPGCGGAVRVLGVR